MRWRADSCSDADCRASRRCPSGTDSNAASSSVAYARPYQYAIALGNASADSYSDPGAYAGPDTYCDTTPDCHARTDTYSDAASDCHA